MRDGNRSLTREFRFDDFGGAFGLVARVALLAEAYFVTRTMRALELLAFGPVSVRQLAAALQIHERTARRMLGRLVDEEYVTRLDEPRRRYVLTLRVAALASQAVKRSELARAASPVVAVLHRQTGLTAHLVSPSYDCALCHVHAAEDGTSTPRLRELVSAHCTAGGKTLLAGRDCWRESLLSSPLRARCRGPGASSRRTGGSPPSCGRRRAPPSPSRTASAWRSSCGARRCACARP